jgi:hypothetical protein
MKFSTAQFALIEERYAQRVFDDALTVFERDTRPTDPKLADDIEAYRVAGDFDVFRRITELTNIGAYQRALLAMSLQSGIDFTTDENFGYIVKHPALSGNTKARHIILMAVAMKKSMDDVI